MTLAEVVVLLFFILALILTWRVYLYRNVPAEGVTSWNNWVAAGGAPPDDWTKILACTEENIPRRNGYTCGDLLDSAHTTLAKVADTLGIDTSALSTNDLIDSIAAQLRLALDMARDGIRTPPREPISLPDYINLLRGGGSDPPCWWQFVESSRDIIFVLEVILRTNNITIRPIWPPVYDARARTVTNLVELSQAGTISYSRFRELALPVFQWGQRQNPQCRHFVVIHDSVRGGEDEKEDFKTALLTVESYFYKRLAN